MKKLVISALAASVASATALASESEWADLDRDVQALSASLNGLESTGPKLDGRLRFVYESSGDIDIPVGTGGEMNDLGNFRLLEARLKATGSRGDIGYVFQAEFAGTVRLLDAYINVPIGENLRVRVGQFKALVTRSALVSSGKLFFTDRNLIGALFSGRREGIALLGTFDAFEWSVTVQDGFDAEGDEYFYAIRGQIHFLGEGLADEAPEGAYGAGEEIQGTAGVAYFDDGELDDAAGLLIEAALATSQYSLSAYLADLDEMVYTGNSGSFGPGNLFGSVFTGGALNDTSPFGLMGTFMITQATDTQGGWEVGARFQDLDDMNDTNILEVGVNYYGCGHNYKYFLNWENVDNDILDIDIIRLGVALGF